MQTAVEWLINELNLEGYDYTVKQALEKEEQQRKDDYLAGLNAKEDIDYYNETYGSNGSDEHIVEANEMISIGDKTRYQKLETIVKLLAKSWFYGDWEWETPNERIMQMLMQELGYYPFNDEHEMIKCTGIHDELYKKAVDIIPIRKLRMPLTEHIGEATEMIDHSEQHFENVEKSEKPINLTSSQTEISDEEIEEILYHHSYEYAYGFKDAIKWYREQLKKKQ